MRRRDLLRLLGTLALAGCSGDDGVVAPASPGPTAPTPDGSPSMSSDPGPPELPDAPSTAETTPEAVAAAPVTVDLLCRDAWRARPANDGMTAHSVTQITIHHPAAAATTRTQGPGHFRSYQAFHQDDRGWADIAYHVGIDRTGHVFMLRPWDRAGDTGTEYDPATHFLVLVDGNFDEHDPSPAQLESAARVVAWASGHFGVGLDTVAGHRDHASTSCPGDALYARLPDLVARAGALAEIGVDLREVCGDDATAIVAAIEDGTAADAVTT